MGSNLGKISGEIHEFFEEIYNETYYELFKYILLRSNNHTEAQDIVQSTYSNFFQRLKKHGKSHFKNYKMYLYKIAKGELSSHYKDKALKTDDVFIDDEEEFLEPADLEMNIDELVDRRLFKESIWEILRQKDPLTFKIFTLHFLYDYKISSIASELGINESTVKSRLYRTLRELRIVFEQENYSF